MAALVAHLGAAAQPAPAVHRGEVAELGLARRRPERHLATLHVGKRACHLRGERGYRLERDVARARRDLNGLGEHLAPVRAGIHIGPIAAQRAREHRPHRDLLVQRAARVAVGRGQQLGAPEAARDAAERSPQQRASPPPAARRGSVTALTSGILG